MPLSLSFLKQYLLRSEATEGGAATFQHEAAKHLTSLYNFALGLAKNEEDAADLVQETYLRALRFQRVLLVLGPNRSLTLRFLLDLH